MADRIIAEMGNREWGFTAVVVEEQIGKRMKTWSVTIIKADGRLSGWKEERVFEDKEAALRHAATVAYGFQFEERAPAGEIRKGSVVRVSEAHPFVNLRGALADVTGLDEDGNAHIRTQDGGWSVSLDLLTRA